MLRVQHSSQCGRGVVFPLPYQTLLVGFKVGNPLPDFFALRATVCTENPIQVYRMIESAKLAR
jgi:hypothetical protein